MASDRPIRLQVYLARCGVGSRRQCEALITGGLVRVDGRTVTKLGTKVSGTERIEFRGKPVEPESTLRYLAVNKPRGYVCTNSDPQGRPIAAELFSGKYSERLYHIGRLDLLSDGLVFYTNDGSFAAVVSHPSSCIEKEYLVETPDRITVDTLDRFVRGVTYCGVHYRIDGYTMHGARRVTLRLHEGKNREIRRLFEYADRRITRLTRTRIGVVTLASLGRRAFRELADHEVEWFTRKGAST